MPQGWPEKPDRFPLLASEKHFFLMNTEGRLQHCLYNRAANQVEGCREMFPADLFGQKLHGFDAVVDSQGAVHLLGYEQGGGLFYLPLSLDDPQSPLLLYRDQHKKIEHLSACRDQKNSLHLFFLARDEKYKVWWLFYLYSEQQNGKQKWAEPLVIDFGYGPWEQYGLIGSDSLNRIFFIYRLCIDGEYTLVFRLQEKGTKRPGKTVFLPKEGGGSCFPSFLLDPDDTLHLSWLSRQEKTTFLNYACRTPAGEWENSFNLEIPLDSFFLAPLFYHRGKLLLTWKNDRVFFHLYLSPEKKERKEQVNNSWRWGKNQTITEEIQPLRLRPADNPGGNFPGRGSCIFAATGYLPQRTPQPHELLPYSFEEDNEVDEALQGLHILDILSSYTLTRAGNLQTKNAYLKQKLEERGKEFSRLYTANLVQRRGMKEELSAKIMELEKIEKLLQKTLAELQKSLQQQKEKITMLQAECNALQKENKKLKEANFTQTANLSQFQEKIVQLTQENESLQAPKTSFLHKLIHKISRQAQK